MGQTRLGNWGKGHLFHGNRPFFRGEGNKDNIGEQPSRHTLLTFFSPQFITVLQRGQRVSNGYFKENFNFPRFQLEGVQPFSGANFYRNPYNL